MTRLLRLYPGRWRARYEAEFLDLIEARPPSPRDVLDILLGAFDARLHPELVEPGPDVADEAGPSLATRLGALPAIAAGVIWAAAGLYQASIRIMPTYKDSTVLTVLVVIALVLGAIAVLATLPRLPIHRTGARNAAICMVVAAVLMLGGWPLLLVGFFLNIIVSAIFGGILFTNGRRVAGLSFLITALVLTSFNTENNLALLSIPYGVAWVVVGLSLALQRPSPVIATTVAEA
jgi:hypothetical protein